MKRQKKLKNRLKVGPPRRVETRKIGIQAESLVPHIHHAEQVVIPLIKEMKISPAPAQFLLAQYTQVFATGSHDLTMETIRHIRAMVLELWQCGMYIPSPEYPFTLEETLEEIKDGRHDQQDYSHAFQPYLPSKKDQPRGIGQVPGGIAKHPETGLWQIWLILDGMCECLAAFRDATRAQTHLEEIINAFRRGDIEMDSQALRHRLQPQEDGKPQQLLFEMLMYLIKHLDNYIIRL